VLKFPTSWVCTARINPVIVSGGKSSARAIASGPNWRSGPGAGIAHEKGQGSGEVRHEKGQGSVTVRDEIEDELRCGAMGKVHTCKNLAVPYAGSIRVLVCRRASTEARIRTRATGNPPQCVVRSDKPLTTVKGFKSDRLSGKVKYQGQRGPSVGPRYRWLSIRLSINSPTVVSRSTAACFSFLCR